MLTRNLIKPEMLRFRKSSCVLLVRPLLVAGLLFVAQVAVSSEIVDAKPGDVRTIMRDMLVALDRQDAEAAFSHLYFADPEHAKFLTERLKGTSGPATGYQAGQPIYIVTDEAGPFRKPGQYLFLLPLRGNRYRAELFQMIENGGKMYVLFEPKHGSIWPRKQDEADMTGINVEEMRQQIIKNRIDDWEDAEGLALRWMLSDYLDSLRATRRATLFAEEEGIRLINGANDLEELEEWIHELDEMAPPLARDRIVSRLRSLL